MIDFGVGTEIGFGVRAMNHQKRFEIGDEKIFEKHFEQVIYLGEFSGCYKPTPLKMNLVLEIRLVSKEMGKLLLQSIFTFPRNFFYSMSTPLNSANPYLRVSCPPFGSVQNLDRYFLVSQVWLQIYCFHWHVLCLGYP